MVSKAKEKTASRGGTTSRPGATAGKANLVFGESNIAQLKGEKIRDVYTKVYDARETVFLDQTGQFTARSQRGSKYIMVMVEIDSNAILMEPIKSRTDPELTRAYRAMMLRLKRAGIVPRKHILDNEVSEAMKNVIRDEYSMDMELVPPGCHLDATAETRRK